MKAWLDFSVLGGLVLDSATLDDEVSRFLLPARDKSRVNLGNVARFCVTAFDGFLLLESRRAIERIYPALQKMHRFNCFLRVLFLPCLLLLRSILLLLNPLYSM